MKTLKLGKSGPKTHGALGIVFCVMDLINGNKVFHYFIILFLIYLLNRYISTVKCNLVQRIELLKTVDTVSVRKAGQEEGPCMCGLGPEVNSQEVRSKATDG